MCGFYRYELLYPGVSYLPNPLWDDGFRVKRYDSATESSIASGLHSWHVDRDSGTSCRELAVIFYLSAVPRGGETLFRSPQKRAVTPVQGAVLVFPASHSHVHAGAPPIEGRKYIISNFVSSCDMRERVTSNPPE